MPRKTDADYDQDYGGDQCFNEAAARCRGKLRMPAGEDSVHSRFNEAAARCRGKRKDAVARRRRQRASMRPRPDAAENSLMTIPASMPHSTLQ